MHSASTSSLPSPVTSGSTRSMRPTATTRQTLASPKSSPSPPNNPAPTSTSTNRAPRASDTLAGRAGSLWLALVCGCYSHKRTRQRSGTEEQSSPRLDRTETKNVHSAFIYLRRYYWRFSLGSGRWLHPYFCHFLIYSHIFSGDIEVLSPVLFRCWGSLFSCLVLSCLVLSCLVLSLGLVYLGTQARTQPGDEMPRSPEVELDWRAGCYIGSHCSRTGTNESMI